MNQSASGYISNRVLKLNVGFLLSQGPGYSRDSEFDLPTVLVAEDLLVQYVRGPLRLSRTKEGILVQAALQVAVEMECSRCLDAMWQDFHLTVEELYAYPPAFDAEFSVHDDGILDFALLLRAEVLILLSQPKLCRPDCKGICPECGANRNHTGCDCAVEKVDPRLESLKDFLNR